MRSILCIDSGGVVKSRLSAVGCHRKGEIFDRSKHVPGTEVKAITYSAMQIHEGPERIDLYFIVDI